ncbi:lipopolysaccharide biosynthesis protein [Spirosoma foliorum]|uniref:Polysaccharide biosynthesis protein n=1 Tax=Spirosoma foliorum TaxID=2710596 RepID=A0A7G5H0E0_9BACT|nr:hypothetical protein [Spirosoma foliorum]QMW04582.1 hypothetical protein H3H32_06510 [Spirosoma foliorum]
MNTKYITYFIKLWNSPTITTWASFLSKSFNVTIVMPLILSRLTTGDVNLWYLYATVISLQILLDAGFGSAFVRVIAYGTVGFNDFTKLQSGVFLSSDEDGFNESFITTVYHLMMKVYKLLCLIGLLILITVGSWAFMHPIQESSQAKLGWLTWGMFSITFPIILWGNVYLNLLQGTHNVPLVRRWDTLFNLISSASCIILLIIYPNVYILVIVTQFWMLVAVYRNYRLVANKYPFLKQNLPDTDKMNEIRKNVVPSALKSGLGLIMSQGIIQLSGFVYAQLATPAALASYLLGLNLIQAIRNFAQAPFYSRLPELAAYTGKGDIDQLKNVARRNMFRVYLIFSIGFFSVTFLHEPLFKLIHSNIVFPDPRLWGLMGLAFLVDRYGAMHLQVYSTTNHIIWHTLNGITGVLMIGLSIFLYPFMAIYALPVSMLSAYVLCYSWYAPYKSYKFIKTSFFQYEWNTFLPFILILILFTFFT